MLGSDIFISSCSRRQLSRRRPPRDPLRLQILVATVILALALAAFVLGHGGL